MTFDGIAEEGIHGCVLMMSSGAKLPVDTCSNVVIVSLCNRVLEALSHELAQILKCRSGLFIEHIRHPIHAKSRR
jgi:hypothetical protein